MAKRHRSDIADAPLDNAILPIGRRFERHCLSFICNRC
jgi:hypothetical protein